MREERERATMKSSSPKVEQALEARTFREMRKILGFRRPVLSLTEIRRLSGLLASFRRERPVLKIALLRTYSTELLRPYWTFESSLAGFDLDLHEAPLGSLLQEGQRDSDLLRHEPEATFFLLKWPDLDPRFLCSVAGLSADERQDLAESAEEGLLNIFRPLREALPGLLVLTLLPPFGSPALGLAESMVLEPEAEFTARLKTRLTAALRTLPAVYFFDLDNTLMDTGRENFFDARLWQVAQFPFSVRGAQAVVRGLFTTAWLLKGPLTKCIVLDADNTLWGGIVGEDGPEAISLGTEPPGSAYVAFQRRLLEFRERGILLALCSRNNWTDVREVLSRHPHQLLRVDHFAAIRVNWKSKADNLRSMAEELKLGLESFLFVDDSPQECLLAEKQFPELTVVRIPESPTEIPTCLDGVPGLERLSLTEEDTARSLYYAQDRQRRRLEVESSTVSEYLATLRMVMTIGLDDLRAVARIAQLTQKTNQFNVTTRRYSEAEIERGTRDPDCLVAHFSLSDVFGESGVVGLALIRGISGPDPEFDTFLQSCRVIGRGAETAFLHSLIGILRTRGARLIRSRFVPTTKNALVQNFWTQHGFHETQPGLFECDLTLMEDAENRLGPISVSILAGAASAEARELRR